MARWIDNDLAVPAAQELPYLFVPDAAFVGKVVVLLEDAYENSRLNSLLTCCFLLLRLNRDALSAWLAKRIPAITLGDKFSVSLMAYSAVADWKILLGSLDKIRSEKQLLWELCYSIARALRRIPDSVCRSDICRQLLARLSREQWVAFFYFLAKENNPGLNEIWELMNEAQECDAVLVRSIAHRPATPSICYAVTSRTVQAINDRHAVGKQRLDKDTYRALDSKKGVVYFDGDGLTQGLSEVVCPDVLSLARIPTSTYTDLANIVSEIARAPIPSACMFEDLVSG